MFRSTTYFLFTILVTLSIRSVPLCAQSLSLPSTPKALEDTFWGLCIQDASTAETLVDIRSHHLFTPASTAKVYSTATLYALSQPIDRIPTYVCATGPVRNGTLTSDLYLVGKGDPSLGSRYLYGQDKDAFFKQVLESLRQRGIKAIDGSIIALSPVSDFQGQNPRWLLYDMGNHYGAGAYDLNVFDNSFEIRFTDSGRHYTVFPPMPDVSIADRYERSARMYGDSLYLSPGLPLQAHTTIDLTGVYPSTRKTLTIRGSIPNPPLQLAHYLLSFLRRGGIIVKGKADFVDHLPTTAHRDTLCTYLSPTLRELIRTTNVYSHNLYAEAIMRLIGRDRTPLSGHNALQTSLEAARAYWASRGLDTEQEEFCDGCGLSVENKVSPHFMATLLGKMYRDTRTRDYASLLPLAGREGTLSYFLKDTPLEGKARLKSGTIRNVVAYAGYVYLGDKVYTVAIYVNNYYGRASDIRKAMESLLLEAFSLAPSAKEAA